MFHFSKLYRFKWTGLLQIFATKREKSTGCFLWLNILGSLHTEDIILITQWIQMMNGKSLMTLRFSNETMILCKTQHKRIFYFMSLFIEKLINLKKVNQIEVLSHLPE